MKYLILLTLFSCYASDRLSKNMCYQITTLEQIKILEVYSNNTYKVHNNYYDSIYIKRIGFGEVEPVDCILYDENSKSNK